MSTSNVVLANVVPLVLASTYYTSQLSSRDNISRVLYAVVGRVFQLCRVLVKINPFIGHVRQLFHFTFMNLSFSTLIKSTLSINFRPCRKNYAKLVF